MHSPQDRLLKSLADETARLLNDGGESAVLPMERLGLLSLPEKSSAGARPGVVGIWEGGAQGYQRAEALRDQWRLWADVQLIPPKGEKKRLLLLGESVARGFLYDPDFNPAKALEACVPAVLGEPVEVVDLAKTDLTGSQLTSLISVAPALEPDLLVVFAGNNWLLADPRDRLLEATALREGGAPGLKARREQRLATFVATLRRQLEELSARIPIVLVVPEINLLDWRFGGKADAPWLPPGRNRRWLECQEAAFSALASGHLEDAAALAREMVDLDGGTAASGWIILADCARGTGDLAAARTCLEKARDAHLWDLTQQTPRAVSVIQRTLRECALPDRISVVDLPTCFSAWQGGELPGRHLFLDYCHLSADGIRVAMAATALEVAALLDAGRALPGIESLVNEIPPPSPEIEATAHFAAALQSSHEGQPGSFVAYLCHEAARRSVAVAQAMREFLEVRTRRAPTWGCTAYERLSSLVAPFLRRYVLLSPKLFEAVLLPAIAKALETNDLPSLTFLEELRKDERGLTDRPSDLLDPYYRVSLRDPDWLESSPYLRRAYSPTSRYPWISRIPREVVFELNCRRTGTAEPGECEVRVNGTRVTRLPLTREWSTFHFSAPGELVRGGVNWLEIDWPLDLPGGQEEIEHAAREHEHGRFVPLFPAFAEISLLTAVER